MANFKIISQKCSSHASLPKLLGWFHSAKENAARAKNRKTLFLGQGPDFKIILLKCSSHTQLPKLLKWFGSTEQNGRQS